MFDLTGRKALITGASGGIGQAIARALHAQGAHVALHGTRVEKLEALAQDLGKGAFATPADLTDMAAVKALPAQAVEAMGGLDILVNNAGITRDQLAMRLKEEDWDMVFQVNLKAAFELSRAVLRPMMKARFGRIISIGSIVGTTGNAGQTNYAAAKAALTGMSKSLAQEIASRGITVNVIAPGFVQSDMTDALGEEQKAALLGQIPMGRMGQGADIAAAAVYLSSMEAGWVTGQTLHINGGMAML